MSHSLFGLELLVFIGIQNAQLLIVSFFIPITASNYMSRQYHIWNNVNSIKLNLDVISKNDKRIAVVGFLCYLQRYGGSFWHFIQLRNNYKNMDYFLRETFKVIPFLSYLVYRNK